MSKLIQDPPIVRVTYLPAPALIHL